MRNAILGNRPEGLRRRSPPRRVVRREAFSRSAGRARECRGARRSLWAIRRPRLALRVALCCGSAPGVRGAARWTARARARNGARTDRLSQSGQFDELGLLCVSHYVAEAPQAFEALPDGPQVGGVRMARGRIASRQCGSRPKEALRCHRHGSVRLIYGAGGHHGRRVDGVDGSTTMDRVAAGKLPTTERRDIAAQRDRRVSRPVGRRAAPERRVRAGKHY